MRELESAIADALSLPDLKDGVSRAELMNLNPGDLLMTPVVKICKRIADIEHALACKDQSEREAEELGDELELLERELETLHPDV